MTSMLRRFVTISAMAFIISLAAAADARAEGFISPLVGFNFGGDSGCPTIGNCEDKRMNLGVGVGSMGNVLGFEAEFAYAKDFFGESPAFSSSVATVMANAMIVPNLGPVRPYATIGLGLVKANVDTTPDSLLASDNNDIGWNIGGGVFIFFGPNVGVRGDVRYFHSFEEFEVFGQPLADTKLDFGRASGAFVLKW
jgi:opacity protein-like surface antigen